MANAPYYPEGKYVAVITGQALTESQNTKTPQIVFEMEILGPVDPANPANYVAGKFQRYKRTAYLYITDKSVERTVKVLRHLGYDRESFKFIDPSVDDAFGFVGMEPDVFCKHEAKQDGTGMVEKWGISTPSEGMNFEPLEPKRARELDALFGKTLKSAPVTPRVKSGTDQPAAVAAGPSGLEIGDDDLPF
jgi:hypothetical protein